MSQTFTIDEDDIIVLEDSSMNNKRNIAVLKGEKGEKGDNGLDGKDGRDGRDGADGKDGAPGLDGKDGKDGKDGSDGKDGKDGLDGKNGLDGKDGKDGKDGVDGITTYHHTYSQGGGGTDPHRLVPTGGNSGQVLTKLSDLNNDFDWQDNGNGSVSDFSFTNSSGITGTVTNPTTTPNLSLSLALTTANFASPNISQWTNDSGYITNSFYHGTGVKYGGVGTVNGGLGVGTTIDVTAGAGFIMNNTTSTPTYTAVTWNASTNISLVNTGVQYTYWYIDSSGTLTQTTTAPTRSTFRTRIWLFRTSYTGGVISGIAAFPVPIDQPAAAMHDLNTALGAIRISGADPTASGANLKLKINSGQIYNFGANLGVSLVDPNVITYATFDTAASSTFRYATTSGTVLVDVTNIDPANYQVAGVVTAIPGSSSRVTIQYVLGFQGGLIRVLYGNAFYASTTEALAALQVNNPYDCAPVAFTNQNSVVLGAIIATKGTTDLTTARFVTTNKFFAFGSGSSASIGGAFMLTDMSNGSFSSANLAAALTDETGTGSAVFANSPVFGGFSSTGIMNTTLGTDPSGSNHYVLKTTGGVNRFGMGLITNESGSNNGSDFYIFGYNDAGAFLTDAFRIKRSTGAITVGVWNATPINLSSYASGTLQAAQFPALTGDITTSSGNLATTLATVNANVGSFGSSTAIPNFTVNAKGLITAAGTSAVVAPAGTLTGTTLASNVVTSSLTTVGTIGTGVWQGSIIGATYGGTGSNGFTAGSVVFSDGAKLTELNAAFSFNSVTQTLSVSGTIQNSASVNGEVGIICSNSSSGSSAYSILRIGNNGASDFVAFLNSSTRAGDGGANTGTIRNDAGSLRLQGSGSDGIYINSSSNVGINVIPVNKLDVNGALVVGNSYAGVNTAPSNGALIQGQTIFGATSAFINARVEIQGSDRITFGMGGTKTATDGSSQACFYVGPTYAPISNTSVVTNFLMYPQFNPPTGVTITTAYGMYLQTGGQGGLGSVTTGYNLYVDNPNFGTTQICAYFGGVVQFNSSGTGTTTALLATANCPATTGTAPYVWLKFLAPDGSTVYVPGWK